MVETSPRHCSIVFCESAGGDLSLGFEKFLKLLTFFLLLAIHVWDFS